MSRNPAALGLAMLLLVYSAGAAIAEEPPRGTLDVGEAGLVGEIEEFLSAIEHKLQLSEQHVGVETDAAVEGDEIAVEIVEHLDTRTRLRKEDGKSSGERFDVASVLTDFWQDVLEQAALSAWPGDGGFYAIGFGVDAGNLMRLRRWV